ncbi:MAG: hypothetical protein WC942_04205 [Clostridia bacterium]|jgi:hypothetical protein
MLTVAILVVSAGVIVQPVRNMPGNSILIDVQNQLVSGHPYNDPDPITTVHECTHGINSRLRGLYHKPSFYVLKNRAFIFHEVPGTLRDVANKIPINLRGDVYKLYLVDSRRWWNDTPSYVFDEFVAYTNGSIARYELGIPTRIESIKYMMEFVIYSYYAATTPESKEFWAWNTRRAWALYELSGVKLPYVESIQFQMILREAL